MNYVKFIIAFNRHIRVSAGRRQHIYKIGKYDVRSCSVKEFGDTTRMRAGTRVTILSSESLCKEPHAGNEEGQTPLPLFPGEEK